MGIVDIAKSVQGRAVDLLLPQRFVFHHVPKCGGTSVSRALRRRYLLSQTTVSPEASFQAFATFTGREDREQMLIDVLDLREQMLLYHMHRDVRGIALHVRFSEAALAAFAGRYKFVTLLRDPVDRFLSHYNWSHGRTGAHARIDEAFDRFLDTPRAARIGASYAEFFSGLPKEAPLDSAEAIDRAVANLGRFALVGRLDDLPGFAAGLRRELGVRVRIGHENRSTSRPGLVRRAELTAGQHAAVERLCAPDLAIWSRVAEQVRR